MSRASPVPMPLNTQENNMKKILMMSIATIAAMVLLSGCNTVAGIGKDFERLGEKVQDASKK